MKIKKKIPLIFGMVGILLIVIIIISASSGNGDVEIVKAEKRDLTETIRISGNVQADMVSDLGFETSGSVKNVYVKVNDRVVAGQKIATLNLGTLPADLKSAEADVVVKRAEMENESLSLETIKKQQDTLVKNAYEELLSGDLVAEPRDHDYDQTPPTITGRYSGTEGRYTVDISSGYSSSVHLLRTFDLEKTDPIDINKTGPTKLGTRGLFIDFADDLSSYDNTIWYVDVPNKTSSTYSTRLSAYKEALSERTRAIEEAETNLRTKNNSSSISNAELAKAEASVERIRAQIADRTLVAPFSGTITQMNIDLGEVVAANQSVVSIISDGKLGVDVDLPEIDSIKVMIGDKAEIKLDAFKEKIFPGTVISVNRSETLVDGISVYEARIVFDNPPKDIYSGMTANISIVTDSKESVLAVPLRALGTKKDGSHFLEIIDENGDKKEVDVNVGIESTDGYVEIISGISEGAQVAVNKK